MLRLLKFLITGSFHMHKYVPVEKHKTSTYSGHAHRPHTITHTYVGRCECGKIQSRSVNV